MSKNVSVSLAVAQQPLPAGVVPGGFLVQILNAADNSVVGTPINLPDATAPAVFPNVPAGSYLASAAAVAQGTTTAWSTAVTQAFVVPVDMSDAPVSVTVALS
jgi:hypothetical protein